MVGIKLSHTQVNMYHECGEKYRLYYREKLREIYLHSRFFFGSALDEGFSRILLEKKKNLTEEELELLKKHENDIFISKMEYKNHNRELIYVPTFEHARYTKGDFDFELLTDEDSQLIKNVAEGLDFELNTLSDVYDFIQEVYKFLTDKKKLDTEMQIVYNYIVWRSLIRKGLMMLKAYREQILPQIHEVFSLQRKVVAEEGDDTFEGFIDAELSFVDNPSEVYTADNKSSSRPYGQNDADDADQLQTYDEMGARTGNVAFLVIVKKLYKKEPIIRTQILKAKVKPENVDKTFNRIEEAYNGITGNIFVQNFANRCYSYGSPCPYYKKCHRNSEEGLVKVWKDVIDEKREAKK